MIAVAKNGGVRDNRRLRRPPGCLAAPAAAASSLCLRHLVTQIPFALTVYYSFFSWNLLKDNSFKFAGLENYARLVTDESIRIAVWNTVVLTIAVIGISVVLAWRLPRS